jgi:hypothetical protein
MAALASAQEPPAQPAQKEKPKRNYSGKVQMHPSPFGQRVPDAVVEDQQTLTDALGRPETSAIRSSAAPPPPPIPARVNPQAVKKKNGNWILPPPPDGESREKQDIEPTGWGWLADDVLSRQKKREDAEGKDAAEEQGSGDENEATTDKDRVKKKTEEGGKNSGALVPFEPVATDNLVDHSRQRTGMDTAIDESKASSEKAEKDKTEPEKDKDAEKAAQESQARDKTLNLDRVWGNDAMWDHGRQGENPLPQTAALLSRDSWAKDMKEGPLSSLNSLKPSTPNPTAPDVENLDLARTPESPAASQPAWHEGLAPAVPRTDGSYAPPSSVGQSSFESPFSSGGFTPAPPTTPSTAPADTAPLVKNPWNNAFSR